MSTDPTRTKRIRDQFEASLRSGFDQVSRLASVGIRDNNALGLQIDAPSSHRFNFPSNKEKADAFYTWLQQALDEEVLDTYNGETFIRQGAEKGIVHADDMLKRGGIDPGDTDIATTLNMPVHRQKLEQIYTRAFEDLKDITDETADILRDTMAKGLAEGKGPDAIASDIVSETDKINNTRATVMARTEVVRAHSEATLNRYEQIGGNMNVTVKAEFSTAEDLRVCPICQQLEGKTYSITEMRNATFKPDGFSNRAVNEFPVQPPVHPQCRCVVLPVSTGVTGLEVIEQYNSHHTLAV